MHLEYIFGIISLVICVVIFYEIKVTSHIKITEDVVYMNANSRRKETKVKILLMPEQHSLVGGNTPIQVKNRKSRVNHVHKSKKQKKTSRVMKSRLVKKSKPKLILLYTEYYKNTLWEFQGQYYHENYEMHQCPQSNCKITYNHLLYSQSDAVVFHGRDLPPRFMLDELRLQDQNKLWIWHYEESPVNAENTYYSYNGLFNWTSSYHLKSEIFNPYDYVQPLGKSDKVPPRGTNFALGKDKIIVTLISNCRIRFRMDLVRAIKRYLPIDVYGWCAEEFDPRLGETSCPHNSEKCRKRIGKYKFYFTVENSMCDGYVTEKFYENALLNGLVPVVLTGADLTNPRIAPKHSFINIRDFKTIKSLTDYLKYLDKNDTAYNEYHQWRYTHKIVKGNIMCRMCKGLWDRDTSTKSHTAQNSSGINLSDFWSIQQCDDFPSELIDITG